jgi:transposase
MGYSKEYKVSVIKYHFKGNTIAKTAETFSIGIATVNRWKRELKDNGELQGRKTQNREHLRKITPEKIDEFLQKFPDGNQKEMAEYFGCKAPSVTIALKKFNYTRKKNKSDTMKPTKGSARYTWIKSPESSPKI